MSRFFHSFVHSVFVFIICLFLSSCLHALNKSVWNLLYIHVVIFWWTNDSPKIIKPWMRLIPGFTQSSINCYKHEGAATCDMNKDDYDYADFKLTKWPLNGNTKSHQWGSVTDVRVKWSDSLYPGRCHWTHSVSSTCISVMRFGTADGDTAIPGLPPYLWFITSDKGRDYH